MSSLEGTYEHKTNEETILQPLTLQLIFWLSSNRATGLVVNVHASVARSPPFLLLLISRWNGQPTRENNVLTTRRQTQLENPSISQNPLDSLRAYLGKRERGGDRGERETGLRCGGMRRERRGQWNERRVQAFDEWRHYGNERQANREPTGNLDGARQT